MTAIPCRSLPDPCLSFTTASGCGCVLRGLGQGKERTEIRGWVTLSFTPRRHTRQPGVTHRGADISEIEKQQVLVQLIKAARFEGGWMEGRRATGDQRSGHILPQNLLSHLLVTRHTQHPRTCPPSGSQECRAACTILIWTIEHVLHIHNSIITSPLAPSFIPERRNSCTVYFISLQ